MKATKRSAEASGDGGPAPANRTTSTVGQSDAVAVATVGASSHSTAAVRRASARVFAHNETW